MNIRRVLILHIWPVALAAMLITSAFVADSIPDPIYDDVYRLAATVGAGMGLISAVMPSRVFCRCLAAAISAGALTGRALWVVTAAPLSLNYRITGAVAYLTISIAAIGLAIAAIFIQTVILHDGDERGDR